MRLGEGGPHLPLLWGAGHAFGGGRRGTFSHRDRDGRANGSPGGAFLCHLASLPVNFSCSIVSLHFLPSLYPSPHVTEHFCVPGLALAAGTYPSFSKCLSSSSSGHALILGVKGTTSRRRSSHSESSAGVGQGRPIQAKGKA